MDVRIFWDPKLSEETIGSIRTRLHVLFSPYNVRIDEDIDRLSPVKAAYNCEREQHSANELLDQCQKKCGGDKQFLYVVADDLYHGTMNFVLGLGRRDQGAVASLNRLDDDVDEAVKLCVHEIGHVIGLKHCQTTSSCVMTFANSVEELHRTSARFCQRCSKLLQQLISEQSSR